MNDRMNDTPHFRAQDPGDGAGVDPTLERALAEWGRRQGPPSAQAFVERVFKASRPAIAARRGTRRPTSQIEAGGRFRRVWRSPMPARLALAAGLVLALLLPATLDLGGGGASRSGSQNESVAALETAEVIGGVSASEPLLLAMIDPDAANWEDIAGHESGVDLYAVLESGRAGLDDYLLELDAIFGTLDGVGEEM
jgi:hypothetical protein